MDVGFCCGLTKLDTYVSGKVCHDNKIISICESFEHVCIHDGGYNNLSVN